MIREVVLCRHCRSQNSIKHGHDKRGIQRFLYQDCQATFQKPEDDRHYSEDFKRHVLVAYQEGASRRAVGPRFRLSRPTLNHWLRRSQP